MYILIKESLGDYTPKHPETLVCSRFGNNLKDYVDNLTFKSSGSRVFRHADEWEYKELRIDNTKKEQVQERRFYFLTSVIKDRYEKNWYEHTIVYRVEELEEI